jgi:hypothetical protein
VGFLTPQNLFYGLSLALLLLIYLRSRSRPTIEVSSLMLFEEAPAPVASVRHVRIDLLFWIEILTLAALTLAIAGLYIRTAPSVGHGRSHALVFDLGAGMSARDGSGTRLEQARALALELIGQAPVDDQFSIIGYALEAELRHPQTSNRVELRSTLDALAPMAVPARAAALRAALMRARGTAEIELFADRTPAPGLLADVASVARVNFHRVGSGDSNLAIVSLDPGVLNTTRGRAVIRNFSAHPHPCELAIELGNAEVFHETLMLAPHEQIVVPYGPLRTGGLLHARILTDDAIAADNSRYAYAVSDRPARILVLSPEASVREDIARVLLAVDSNFQIETSDPARYLKQSPSPDAASKPLELVVMHDCYVPWITAVSTLFVYPPVGRANSTTDGISVQGTVATAELNADSVSRAGAGNPTMLGSTRIMTVPEWMDPIASAGNTANPSIPVAAIGRAAGGRVGAIAFDLRNHLLLDPDRLEALIVVVDLMKQLTAPGDIQIVATGSYLSIPATGSARVTNPDGATQAIPADKSGRVRIRPLQAGRYQVESAGAASTILANYFDAAESDLGAKPETETRAPAQKTPVSLGAKPPREVRPLAYVLVALALLALMAESAILVRHATRWGMRHV